MKNLSVSKVVWKRLRQVKEAKGFKHLSQCVEFLLDQYESKSFPEEKTTIVFEQKPTREDVIREIANILDEKGY
jgi:hypothetical protein